MFCGGRTRASNARPYKRFSTVWGRIWNPTVRQTINFAAVQNCTGRRGRRPCAERVLAIFAAIYVQLVRRGLPAGTSSDEQAFTRFMLKEVQELSGAESEAMVSLAQRAAFAADTLTEEDVTTMRNWYKRLKGNKKA